MTQLWKGPTLQISLNRKMYKRTCKQDNLREEVNSVNKSELIDAVAEATGLKKAEASSAIDAVFGSLVEALAKGDEIRLAGFGTFLVGIRKATEGRNPQTGAKIAIAEARVPKFRPAKALKEAVAK